jgi:hypothetical protein
MTYLLSTLSTEGPVGLKIVVRKAGKLTFLVDEYSTFYSAVLNHQYRPYKKNTHFAHNHYEGTESGSDPFIDLPQTSQ